MHIRGYKKDDILRFKLKFGCLEKCGLLAQIHLRAKLEVAAHAKRIYVYASTPVSEASRRYKVTENGCENGCRISRN